MTAGIVITALRWGLAAPLGVVFLGMLTTNLWLVPQWILYEVGKGRAGHAHSYPPSMIFLMGGLFGFIAMWACPLEGTDRLAWLPPILDPGCVPLLVAAPFVALWRKWQARHDPGCGP